MRSEIRLQVTFYPPRKSEYFVLYCLIQYLAYLLNMCAWLQIPIFILLYPFSAKKKTFTQFPPHQNPCPEGKKQKKSWFFFFTSKSEDHSPSPSSTDPMSVNSSATLQNMIPRMPCTLMLVAYAGCRFQAVTRQVIVSGWSATSPCLVLLAHFPLCDPGQMPHLPTPCSTTECKLMLASLGIVHPLQHS